MKIFFRFSFFAFFLALPMLLNAQVLISLLFGNALNTDKIEFGLAGGESFSYIRTIDGSKAMNNFDLGFYFHIHMKNHSYISTGVRVKSNVGAKGMPTYPLGDEDFDDVFKDGTLKIKVPCFYVPIMFHQRFNNRWYIELGPQIGLVYKVKNIFETTELDGDVSYTKVVQDDYRHIDAGFIGGVGYKFKKKVKSLSAGISYYYGLVNISKTPDLKVKNATTYLFLKIPIGAGKAEEKAKEKAAAEEKSKG